jgi:hypothetical protein
MGAVTRGWTIKLVIVKENEWESEIRAWFPSARVIDLTEASMAVNSAMRVDVWFADMDPPRKLNLWVTQARFIVTMRRARNAPSSWKYQPITLSHIECGGITSGTWNTYIYSSRDEPLLEMTSRVAGRDLSTILNTKLEGMPCPQPSPVNDTERRVVEVRPKTYHGGGLLPWGSFDAKVIAPSIFSPTGWVRRQLSGSEVLKALDIPDEVETILTSKQVKTICQDASLVPLKVIIWLVDALPGAAAKGSTPEVANKRVKTDHDARESHSLTNAADQNAEASNPDVVDRNAKSTKADDAAIPEYLWNRRITPTLDPLVIAKLDVIRRFALRWRNRNLEHGFFLWFKAAHPSEDLLDFVYKVNRKRKHPQAERDWDAGMDCLRRSRRSTWWEWSDGSRPYFWRWPE